MRILNQNIKVVLLFVLIVSSLSCSKADDSDNEGNPEASNINDYIQGLIYDSVSTLNLNSIGGEGIQLNLLNQEEYEDWPYRGNIITCVSTDYKLERDFNETAILQYTGETVFPGALVTINQDMLNGLPNPLEINRSPISLTIDLPNMGANGTIIVENPIVQDSIKVEIDNALSWWNNNAYVDNYVAESQYKAAKSYTSDQIGLELGVNQQWSNEAYSNEFIGQTDSNARYAYMVIKKVFYTVDVNSPTNPSNFFANGVTLEDVQNKMNEENPPAYISSVQYGQIILLRIRSTNLESNVGLDEVLNYVTGVTDINGVNNEIETIIDDATISVITLDENAEVGTQTINSDNLSSGPGSLNYITEEGSAVYSPTAPGIPIAYQTRYLKDDALVETGYTTNYNTTNCAKDGPFIHEEITVENDSFHDTRFRFRYALTDETEASNNSPLYNLNQGESWLVGPPNGSHKVSIIFQYQYGAGGWNVIEIDNQQEFVDYLYNERCYKFTGGSIWGAPSEIYPDECD